MTGNLQPDGPRRLVLVVDDEDAIRSALQRQLSRLGYDVITAASGKEALALVERVAPAVIVTDVRMPGMDGHTLLRQLNPLGLPSSVILMSGQGALDDAISALREGAVDYLKKPWTTEELAKAVGRATELFDALRDLTVSGSRSSVPPRLDPGGTELDGEKIVNAVASEGQALPIPPLEPLLGRARQVAGNGAADSDGANVRMNALLELVEQDPVLVASFFQLAEATPEPVPASGASRAATFAPGDIRGAASVLGPAAVRELCETFTLREAFPIRVDALRKLNERICRFSISRALAMQGLAGIAEPEAKLDPHDGYLCGLWLDVGASYLLSVISTSMERSGSGITNVTGMTAAITRHHASVGATILRRWEMSRLADLAQGHHMELPPQGPSPLWCAAVLGGALAVRLAGFGDPTGDRDLKSELLARCAYTLGLGDTSLRRLTASLTDRAQRLFATTA